MSAVFCAFCCDDALGSGSAICGNCIHLEWDTDYPGCNTLHGWCARNQRPMHMLAACKEFHCARAEEFPATLQLRDA